MVAFSGTRIESHARIKTGTYTGDGTESQSITGVGFKPKFIQLTQRETVENTTSSFFWTTDGIVDNNVAGMAMAVTAGTVGQFDNRIISVDPDGFTVDDDASDFNPNATDQVYEYLAIG